MWKVLSTIELASNMEYLLRAERKIEMPLPVSAGLAPKRLLVLAGALASELLEPAAEIVATAQVLCWR
ncbi:MAG: hypothetical protein ACLQUY_11975 [Ktedonobacterales bacterium]